MFHRILVPLDGSAPSERVLSWLPPLLGPEAMVFLFHSLPGAEGPASTSHRAPRTPEQAREYLETLRPRLGPVRGEAIVKAGHPADRIISASLQLEADLIAMTARAAGKGPAGVGGVAEAVGRRSPLPVFFVRPLEAPSPRKLRRILLAFDGTPRAVRSLETVRPLALEAGAEAVLLHTVVEGIAPAGKGELDPHLTLAECVRNLQRHGIPARAIVARGHPAEEILAHAGSLDADFIAVGTEGNGDAERWRPLLERADRGVLLYQAQPMEAGHSLGLTAW